jgi:hypothetical protein
MMRLVIFLLATAAGAAPLSYNRDIRPILSENCFYCHGTDPKTREANRRLDTREGALAAQDGIRAIVPGDLKASDLVARIESTDKDEMMPPPKSHKTLKPEQIAKLKQWIAEGAPYEAHWAFLPPQRPAAPAGAIDHFIRARLAAEQLAPSPAAPPETIIRRLSYDLTGLPPTPAEVDVFTAEAARDLSAAVAGAADRLLASPRYGEKMALGWLDLARFADTHGYHLDAGRDMSAWRAWVIEAFNRNQRFDEFVQWQLAGDLLPNAGREQKLASGFMRNGMINFEGGAIAEEYLYAYLVDRVNTFGTTFLGLTVGCAQCHDHKFDPMTTKEFYQLFAYFNAVPEKGLDGRNGNAAPVMEIPTPEQELQIADLRAKLAAAEKKLAEVSRLLAAEQAAWEQSLGPAAPAQWQVLTPLFAKSQSDLITEIRPDKSVYFRGTTPGSDAYTITTRTSATGITALRLEALTDRTFPGGGAGKADNGNFVLTGFEVEAKSVADPARTTRVKFRAADADYAQENFPVSNAIDADPKSGWAVDGDKKKEARTAWFAAEQPFGFPGGTELVVTLRFASRYGGHSIGKPRLALSTDAAAAQFGRVPPDILALVAKPVDQRTEDERAKLQRYHGENVSGKLTAPLAERDALKSALSDALKAVPNTMVMAQMAKPRPTYIHPRGAYDAKGEEVQTGVPAWLGALPADAPPDRRALAAWITDPKHPLMARVTVNRLWKQVFGTGLVKTVNDFGLQGEWPSHPELLDWLAVEFVESGWNVKHLMKLMVTSETYRQFARVTPELLARDPDNRLYARGPRFRLNAEEIRDTALAVSGLLDPRIGGASVSPYQPAGLWEELSSRQDSKNWSAQFFVQSHGADLYRRSLYTFWKRTSPPPQMITFDAPDRETCTASRERTNTPLQALTTMNDIGFIEAARKLAERIVREGGATPAARIRHAFRLVLAREPSVSETRALAELLARQTTRYADAELARKLLSHGEAPRDEKLNLHEVAAWTILATTLLNLDETVNK